MAQADKSRLIRPRLVAGTAVSVAAHLGLVILLGSAPGAVGSSGAPHIALTFLAPGGEGEAAKTPRSMPDPEAPAPPRQMAKARRSVELVKIKPVAPLRIVKPRKPVKPKKAKIAKKPPKKVAKTVRRHSSKPLRRKARKVVARRAPRAAAPRRADTMAKRPIQTASRVTGDGQGLGGRSPIPFMTTVRFARRPAPAHYPPLSREREEEGVVVVRALVGANGFAGRVMVWKSSGYPRLDEAARKAVRKWNFMPARRGGRAAAAWVQIPVAFRIE